MCEAGSQLKLSRGYRFSGRRYPDWHVKGGSGGCKNYEVSCYLSCPLIRCVHCTVELEGETFSDAYQNLDAVDPPLKFDDALQVHNTTLRVAFQCST